MMQRLQMQVDDDLQCKNNEFFNCFSSERVIDVHTSTIVGIEWHYDISIQYLFINYVHF